MRGIRLGERERYLLLDLSGDLAEGSRRAPEPAADTRSGREVMRRALRRLESLGLVRSEGGQTTLTDLGRKVTATYRQELASGKRIRWEGR
jgi:ribosomal protein S19E (S16A)